MSAGRENSRPSRGSHSSRDPRAVRPPIPSRPDCAPSAHRGAQSQTDERRFLKHLLSPSRVSRLASRKESAVQECTYQNPARAVGVGATDSLIRRTRQGCDCRGSKGAFSVNLKLNAPFRPPTPDGDECLRECPAAAVKPPRERQCASDDVRTHVLCQGSAFNLT